MTRIRPYLLTCCCTASLLLASGRATQLRAETPGAEPAVQEAPCAALGGPFAAVPGETAPSAGKQVAQRGRAQSLRAQHLAPRNRSQHTFFANAAYTAVISTLYLAESSSGSLNEGYDISAGYNWTSRRGFGAGIVYSGGFLAAERNGIRRTSRIHYIAPEFVARQRAGRRWLFRESAGIGYGRYIRSYGDTSGSRGGVGIHESASVEFMLGRHIGLGAGISGQWLIVDSPDVDDGAELSLFGIFRFQFGGGLRVYFFSAPYDARSGTEGRNNCRFFHVVSRRHKQNS